MSKTLIVKYRCTHISCRNPKCYEGLLKLEEEKFHLLNQAEGGNKLRSPSKYCKIASTQVFEILEKTILEETPLEVQIQAQQKIFKELLNIEARLSAELRQVNASIQENSNKKAATLAKLTELTKAKEQSNASNS